MIEERREAALFYHGYFACCGGVRFGNGKSRACRMTNNVRFVEMAKTTASPYFFPLVGLNAVFSESAASTNRRKKRALARRGKGPRIWLPEWRELSLATTRRPAAVLELSGRQRGLSLSQCSNDFDGPANRANSTHPTASSFLFNTTTPQTHRNVTSPR